MTRLDLVVGPNGAGKSTFVDNILLPTLPYKAFVNADEIAFTIAGGMGETDIGGPVLNIVPRSGGNTFQGQAFTNFSNDRLRGDNLTPELMAPTPGPNLRETPGIIKAYDSNISYGGPIARGRLWVYGSYRRLNTETAVEGVVGDAKAFDPSRWDWAGDRRLTPPTAAGRGGAAGRRPRARASAACGELPCSAPSRARRRSRIAFMPRISTTFASTVILVWMGVSAASAQQPASAQPPSGRGDLGPRPASRPDLPRVVNGEMPCAALADEIEAGTVRALFGPVGNPAAAFPDARARAAPGGGCWGVVCPRVSPRRAPPAPGFPPGRAPRRNRTAPGDRLLTLPGRRAGPGPTHHSRDVMPNPRGRSESTSAPGRWVPSR